MVIIISTYKSVVHILIMKDALFQSGTSYLRRIITFFISAQTFPKNLISIGFHQKLHRAPRNGKTAHLIGSFGAPVMSSEGFLACQESPEQATRTRSRQELERTWESRGEPISRDPVQLGGTASGGADWDDLERKCVAIKQHRQQSSTADRCYVMLCCK